MLFEGLPGSLIKLLQVGFRKTGMVFLSVCGSEQM
jgi:hypothetical protein